MGQKAEKNITDKRFPTANQNRDFSANVAFWYKKGTSQFSKVSPKPPSRDLARTVYTAENLSFTSFLQKVEFNDFGLKLAKSLQTGTQA
jgi:hypothetical protein